MLKEKTGTVEEVVAKGAAGPKADMLAEKKAKVDRLLDAGDDAIERALSGDAEKFLRQTRQSGGQ